MFPGIDGFHWTVAHVVFLSLFFAVVMTIVRDGRLGGVAHNSRLPHPSGDRAMLEVGICGVARI